MKSFLDSTATDYLRGSIHFLCVSVCALLTFLAPVVVADEIPIDAISPVVSYQFPESVDIDPLMESSARSPIVGYQFPEDFSLDILIQQSVSSPMVSYQYFEWPGDDILHLLSSPTASYSFQEVAIGNVSIRPSPTMPAAVVLAFDVPTDLGKVYLIEYKEALSEVAWKLLCRIVGDGRLNTIIEELKRDVHSKFYRTHPEQMDYATNFRFPVDGDWAVNCNSFWSCCHSCYHLGEDVGRDAGTSVFAPAYGIVRHTRQRTKFGNVIIIEHDTGQEILTTVMGHLRADVQVTVGNTVTNGQLLGFLGDSDQNGGWNPHIHFGIHKGAYSGDNAIDCGSGWVYAGYSANTCVEADWYIPTEFINFHDGD